MITKLRTRLLLWFLGAIVLAGIASSITVALTRPSLAGVSGQVMARTMSSRLAHIWGEPEACQAYIEEMRELTGIDFTLRRDVDKLPRVVPRVGRRGGAFAFDMREGTFIPVQRQGALVGAVQFDVGGYHTRWWRLIAALAVALVVLGFGAERVSSQLARPLERVAGAAERFGAGNLGARVGLSPETAGDEVTHVARAFDAMAGRVERIVRDQRELLAAVSHEVRSPLARARVALEIARDRAREPDRGPLQELEKQLLEMDHILADLLAVTRAGLSDVRTESMVFAPWLRARIAAEPNAPEMVSDPADTALNEARVAMDGPLLGRAVHNLVANAYVHGQPSGVPVEVHLALESARVVVRVRDQGPGFAADLLDRAFEPFVRGDAARTPGHGSGLGLALVRRIVEAHGGEAFARNLEHEGKITGAEVGFALPLA